MRSILKLIRRFVGVLLISILLLFVLNIMVLLTVFSKQTASGSPYTMADEIGKAFTETEHDYFLDDTYYEILEENHIWAMFIDDSTHTVMWSTKNLPEKIPRQYSLSAVSDLTLGYIKGYPTYVGDAADGIIVLGYPKDRYWKSMWPTWDYDFIANLPKTILFIFACNVLLIFVIYMLATGRLISSVNPIIEGIKSLSGKEKIRVKEKGVFSELACSINQASEMLQLQEHMLSKKETARANWIAGVSHDVRTPLSMVMGYAGQLENDEHLSGEARQKAAVIVKQSERMRTLINDLNLVSKLEYNMLPVHMEPINIIAVVRQVAVDFINVDIENKYPIEWMTDEALSVCTLHGDKELIKRAVSNLIQNSIRHNEEGCHIYVSVQKDDHCCHIFVSDDGVGMDDERIEKLNHAPHYMACDENTLDQQHGLGLLIVKQIVKVHRGEVFIRHSIYRGLEAELRFANGVG